MDDLNFLDDAIDPVKNKEQRIEKGLPTKRIRQVDSNKIVKIQKTYSFDPEVVEYIKQMAIQEERSQSTMANIIMKKAIGL